MNFYIDVAYNESNKYKTYEQSCKQEELWIVVPLRYQVKILVLLVHQSYDFEIVSVHFYAVKGPFRPLIFAKFDPVPRQLILLYLSFDSLQALSHALLQHALVWLN